MRKWKNVKYEMPEHGEDVLIYDNYFGYAIGWFESDPLAEIAESTERRIDEWLN